MGGKEDRQDRTSVIRVPEAVGVFDSFEAQQAAFYDLRAVGFHHGDISLLGSRKALEEKLGKAWWESRDLEDDPRAPRAHFVSEEAMGELRRTPDQLLDQVAGMVAAGYMDKMKADS